MQTKVIESEVNQAVNQNGDNFQKIIINHYHNHYPEFINPETQMKLMNMGSKLDLALSIMEINQSHPEVSSILELVKKELYKLYQ